MTIPFDNVSPDLNDMLTKLTQNLTFAVDSLASLKTAISKKRQAPWINSELHALYNKRDAALRRYNRTRNHTALDESLRLRALSTDITKQVRTDYIHDSLEKTLSNNGNFWKRLRSLGLLPKSAEGLHGFSLSTESIDEATAIINIVPDEGFTFKHVSLSAGVILSPLFPYSPLFPIISSILLYNREISSISPILNNFLNNFNNFVYEDTQIKLDIYNIGECHVLVVVGGQCPLP